jgi:hypothetical protein
MTITRRPVTVSVRSDTILHMGLPWSVAVDNGVVARFAEKIRAVHFAYELHEELGGSLMGVELSIEPRTP